MSFPVVRAAVLVAALLQAPGALAAPLSLDQALDLAVQRSRLTAAAQAGTASAAERARAAGQQPDPMLEVGIDNLPVTGPDRFSTGAEDMTMKRIGLSQEWVPADKRAAREAAARAAVRRGSVAEQVAAADVRLQTAMAYIDTWFADEALALALRDERNAREALEAGKGRLATPSGSSAEVLALAGALGTAEDASAESRQQQAAAQAALRRWTGAEAAELSPPRPGPVPAQAVFVQADPAVVAKARDLELARREADLARLERRPDWTWALSYGQRQGRPDMVSFGVRIPLPVAPSARQDRETAAKLAMAMQAEDELDEARRAAEGDYATLASDAGRLQARIDRYRAAVLEPLRQRTATTLAGYASNQASLAMVFDARHAEVEAGRKLLALQRDLARTQARLAFRPVSSSSIASPTPSEGAAR